MPPINKGNVSLTGAEFKEILETHAPNNSSNLVAWKDTWKIFGIVTGIFISITALISGCLAYYINTEISKAISASEKSLHEYVDTQIPVRNPQPKLRDIPIPQTQ